MHAMTNLEIPLATREINELAGARFSKFYEIRENLFLLKIGGKQLLCELPLRLHFTKYALAAPQTPSGFAMLMRKHLEGQRLLGAEQHGLDRIAVLRFERNALVFELFSHGNAVLLDSENTVLAAYRSEEWKDRKVRRGERYAFPAETKADPRELSTERIAAILSASKKPLITALCSAINLAPVYLEEICGRAGVDLKKSAAAASADEAARIARESAGFLAQEPMPAVHYRDGVADFSAFPLRKYAGLESKPFASLSEAVDEFYAHAKAEEKPNPEQERLLRQLEEQQTALKEMLAKADESKATGDAVYADFERIEAVLRLLKEKRDDEAGKLVKELKIERKTGKAVIEI